MRVILVDDEINSIKLLKNYLADYDENLKVVGEFTNPEKAIEEINLLKPDLILLDIEMPQISGFELIERVNLSNTEIIFITAYEQYAIRAIKCSAIDYILKPIDFEELKNGLDKAKLSLQNNSLRLEALKDEAHKETPDYIVIPSRSEYLKLFLSDVLYGEGERGGYTTFYLKNGSNVVASKSLTFYDELLVPNNFLIVQRAVIVNLDEVKSFNERDRQLIFKNGKTVGVSDGKRKHLLEYFKN
ncbi:MAG: response regulator [Bacteroidia bacterium]